MPFGSASPEQKKRFDGVYRGIIVPAVQDAGYEAIREDISATPGSIPKSIIKKLAEAEMVIADLSGINPNVFYELGIRHVLSKSGTVLIINKGETIPFDNASHRVIQYTNELADLDDIHQQIVTAIVNRENNIDNADNIVHDTFPQLPIDYKKYFDKDAQSSKIQELQMNVSKLTQENKQLKNMLVNQGIIKDTTNVRLHRTVKEIMAEARFALQKSGREVILHLHQLALSNETVRFVDYLEDVMEAGYLSEDDYIRIKDLCESSGYLPLELAVMERANDLFPNSNSVIRNLSDVYTRMPLRETKLKGISIIEELLGIQAVDGKYVLTTTKANIDKYNLAALFNAYGRLDFYDRTISVCESYEGLNLPFLPLVMRNKADAYGELKMLAEARKTYRSLLQLDYYDDSTHAFYGNFLADIGEYVEAYREHEIATILDLTDPNRFINLAIEMLNHNYVRIDEETIIRLPSTENIFHYIMPIFEYALDISNTNSIRTRIADILMRRNQTIYADAILSERADVDRNPYQFFPLQYILKADIDAIKKQSVSS